MTKQTRRGFLATGATLSSIFTIDEDGDGDYLDDLLGMDDDTHQSSGVYVIQAPRNGDEEQPAHEHVEPERTPAILIESSGAVYSWNDAEEAWRIYGSTGPSPEVQSITDDETGADVYRGGQSPVIGNGDQDADLAQVTAQEVVLGGTVRSSWPDGNAGTSAVANPRLARHPTETSLTGDHIQETVSLNGNGYDVGLTGNVLATAGSGGLELWDISDPYNVSKLGGEEMSEDPYGVTVTTTHAFTTGGDYLRVWDISDPTDPTEVGTLSGVSGVGGSTARKSLLHEGYLYITCGGSSTGNQNLYVVDVSDSANPTLANTLTSDAFGYAFEMAVQDDVLFVCSRYYDSIRSLDLSSSRTDPTILQTFQETELTAPNGISIQDNYAFVTLADGGDGLYSLDISDPANITKAQKLTTNQSPYGIDVQGTYAAIACKDGDAIQIVDISNPSSMSVVHTATPNQNYDVVIKDGFTFSVNRGPQELNVSGFPDRNYNVSTSTSDDSTGGWSQSAAAYLSSSQSIDSATATKVALDGEDYDTGTIFDSSANEFSIPESGIYQINVGIRLDATDGSAMQIKIYKNGSEYARSYDVGTADPRTVPLSITDDAAAGDTFSLYAYHESGEAVDVVSQGGGGQDITWMDVTRVA